MKLLAAVLALSLVGCESVADMQARVGSASNFQLCRAQMLAPPQIANTASQEAARRGLNCAPYANAVMQQQQNEINATNNLARQLLQPQPAAPLLRPTTTCRTVRIGDSLQTQCN